LYDVTGQKDETFTVAAASKRGWQISGVVGLAGKAQEWAVRMHGDVPERMIPDGPLTPDGMIRVRLARPASTTGGVTGGTTTGTTTIPSRTGTTTATVTTVAPIKVTAAAAKTAARSAPAKKTPARAKPAKPKPAKTKPAEAKQPGTTKPVKAATTRRRSSK